MSSSRVELRLHLVRDDRAVARVVDVRVGHVAGVQVVPAAGVVRLAGAHRADHREVLHLFGDLRQACSLICTSPVVEIGCEGPPVGVPGLRSQMSIVGGPPFIQRRMTDLWSDAADDSAAASTDRPSIHAEAPNAAAPLRWSRKCRRFIVFIERVLFGREGPTNYANPRE